MQQFGSKGMGARPCFLRVGLTVILTSWRSAIKKSVSSLLKGLICFVVQSSRSKVLVMYACARRFFARLASEIFLSSLQTEFFSGMDDCRTRYALGRKRRQRVSGIN